MRHQNWVVKVDYQDGAGTGNILWKLGQGGDFTLQGGTDPTDWQYAQHAPAIVGSSSAGIFSLIMMDNGNDRMFPDGGLCGNRLLNLPCYSTVPVFQINEAAKTATLTFHQVLPPSLYRAHSWRQRRGLSNGNFEYDLCGFGTSGSDIFASKSLPTSLNPATGLANARAIGQ